MGLLSWWKGESKDKPQTTSQAKQAPQPKTESPVSHPEIPGMNGAVAVNGAEDLPDLTVFEFGSVAAAKSPYTMSGYCPVSDDLEPCQWQLDPPSDPNARLFRVVF